MTLQQLRYVIAIEQNGSFCEAAKKMFISQPSISAMIKSLEDELGITIFQRSRQGALLTPDGKDFLKYAYQMLDCEEMILSRFSSSTLQARRQHFSVSSQHYSFVVNAFASLQNQMKGPMYNLRLKETLTSIVIDDVAKQRSEVGVIFLSDMSEKYIRRILKSNHLDFAPLAKAKTCVFLSASHPLAGAASVTVEDLRQYPCIIYDQADDLPLYFSEETNVPDFKPDKVLSITDLWTSIVLLQETQAYNIGSGILDRRGGIECCVVPVEGASPLTIGWIGLQNSILSPIGTEFISLLQDEILQYDNILPC